MQKHILLALLALLLSTTLDAQTEKRWSTQFEFGVARYATASDYTRSIYHMPDRSSDNRSNVFPERKMPFTSLQLNYHASKRWTVAPFASFQYSKGDIFRDDYLYLGKDLHNPEEVIFSQPALHELKVFTGGALVLYDFVNTNKIRCYTGLGVSYMYRSHMYRTFLDVYFSEDYTSQEITEEFSTVKKGGVGLPARAGFQIRFNEEFAMGVNANVQLFYKLKDGQTNVAVAGTYYW